MRKALPITNYWRALGLVMLLTLLSIGCASNKPQWTETSVSDDIRFVINKKGPKLGYSTRSGVKVLTVDGLAFKDLNRNGKLDKYEDWRLSTDERARDLASKMTVQQIAGLMLYSRHQAVPAAAGGRGGFMAGTYKGKPLAESGANAWDLTDQQVDFLTKDHLRHVLITRVQSPEVAARWNNNVQALVEGLEHGIPANNSSDPRHGTVANAEYNIGSGGQISMWPSSIGMTATFDPALVRKFGQVAAGEYRALGITTALSPQVDLATEPRWSRFNGTFGEDPQLAAAMARAYVDGFQTSEGTDEIADGWGYHSVNAMVKHWPGGATGEAGRDAHYGYGKYAVFPGNNLAAHLIPFTQGAFKLEGKTRMASAIMPYYTISVGQDKKNGGNVGNSYSPYIINELLRGTYGFDGVVCTDWGITADEGPMEAFVSRPWGMEDGYTVAERHYTILMAGVDQFGGNNESAPIIEAYAMGVKKLGEAAIRARFEQSAVRLLKNIFRVGLFENPYLVVEETRKIVGQPAFMTAGYEAQLKSIVLLKNKGQVLPLTKNKTVVYVPKRFTPAGRDWFGNPTPERNEYPVSMDILKKYFTVTDDPSKADVGLVFIEGPKPGPGYSKEDRDKGGNGFVPMSLQYGEYTANYARNPSLAGDPRPKDVLNRTYKGKTVTVSNTGDLKMVMETQQKMNGKPVVVSLALSNPAVVAEFEKMASAIVVNFGVQDQAICDILSGAAEPSGLLPMQLPAGMKTVEEQFEDVPLDMECHVDSEGNKYNFTFGMNWKGVINDARTAKYKPTAVSMK